MSNKKWFFFSFSVPARLQGFRVKIWRKLNAMGAFGTILDIGHASGPICAGLLIGWGGYQVCFPLLAGMVFLAIPVFLRNVAEPD